MSKPERPSDPRPNGEPYYIFSECPDCETALVLYQEWLDEEFDEDEMWYDEWWCPDCQHGIYLDHPDLHSDLTDRIDADPDRYASITETKGGRE